MAETATSPLKEPITFQDTADSTYASVTGVIGASKIALNFSNTYGYAAMEALQMPAYQPHIHLK